MKKRFASEVDLSELKQDNFKLRLEVAAKAFENLIYIKMDNQKNELLLFQKLFDKKLITCAEVKKHMNENKNVNTFADAYYWDIATTIKEKILQGNERVILNIVLHLTNEYEREIRSAKAAIKFKHNDTTYALFVITAVCGQLDIEEITVMQKFIDTDIQNQEYMYEHKVIGDLLDIDDFHNHRLYERYCQKRLDELFDYYCKKSDIKKSTVKNYSDVDKLNAIFFSSVPVCDMMQGKYKEIDINLKKYLDDGFITEYAGNKKRLIYYDTKMGVNCGSDGSRDIAALIGKTMYKSEFYFDKTIYYYLQSNKEAVSLVILSAIKEDLLTKLITQHNNSTSEEDSPAKEQIVRGMPLSDIDCERIAEKIYRIAMMAGESNLYSVVKTAFYENVNPNNISACLISYMIGNTKEKAYTKTYSTGKYSETDLMSRKYEEVKTENTLLKNEVATLKNKLLDLEQSSSRDKSAVKRIEEQKEEIKLLNDEIEYIKANAQQLRETISNYKFKSKTAEERELLQEQNSEYTDDFFAERKIIIVGGRWEVNDRLMELMPKTKVVYKETDTLINTRNYDCVIFFSDYINHCVYGKYLNSARINNTPVLYLKGSNMATLKDEIYKFYSDELIK